MRKGRDKRVHSADDFASGTNHKRARGEGGKGGKGPAAATYARFFEDTKDRAYSKEIKFYNKFWSLLAKKDFSYLGFCNLNGSWEVHSHPVGPVWGWNRDKKQFDLVQQGEVEFVTAP